ncbi:MAG: acyltransferase family protein [Pseudomonadota bacterium]
MVDHSTSLKPVTGRTRVDWVDYAKGFCIIFVVMMHATLGVERHAFLDGLVPEGTVGWMNAIVTFAQPFRMPDFFLISGLFLGLVIGRSWLRYFDRKVIHFAYFYVLWLSIQFAFRSIGWVGDGLGFSEILEKFGTALFQPFGTLWFIYMLPVMFLVTRLLNNVHWAFVLAGAAALEIWPIHTEYLLINEFAARYVYFFAGFALAQPIFRLADWAMENTGLASAYLAVWAAINMAFTSTSLPQSLYWLTQNNFEPNTANYSHLPLISLALGGAGAVAVVCVCAMLSKFRLASFLRYLGSHSIVVYLAFFLPMVITRELLFRFAPWLDLGTMSLIVLLTSIVSSVVVYEFTQATGWLRFLFERPKWAWLDKTEGGTPRKAALRPAE